MAVSEAAYYAQAAKDDELTRLRAALTFYRDASAWLIAADGGEMARAALAGEPPSRFPGDPLYAEWYAGKRG
jgi:hypothetical protein